MVRRRGGVRVGRRGRGGLHDDVQPHRPQAGETGGVVEDGVDVVCVCWGEGVSKRWGKGGKEEREKIT
jgi:hypothetical protein